MRFKAIIEYDGGNFFGWQVQPEEVTVQGEIEKALVQITGQAIRISGSGRTDAGVHALGQAASFDYSGELEPVRLKRALNSLLPPSVYVRSLEPVTDAFDARRDAVGKLYRYSIIRGRSPLRRSRAWEYEYPLDISRMREAVQRLEGSHDYGLFCEIGESKILTVDSIGIREREDEIAIDTRGRGFLYKMVRRLAGVICDCGRGKIDAGIIPQLFNRSKPVQAVTAPAQGLVLVEVYYQKEA